MTVFTIEPGTSDIDIPAGAYDVITIVANSLSHNRLWFTGDVSVSQFIARPASKPIHLFMDNYYLRGTAGNDTFDLTGVTQNDGVHSIDLLAGDDTFRAGSDGAWVDGGSGNDKLYGGGGQNTLLGGAGNDRLYGGTGINRLSGGADADVFIAAKRIAGVENDSQNTIADFARGVDKIDISSYGVSSFRQLQFILEATYKGDAFFNANFGDSLNCFTITGVAKAKLSAGDFVFYAGSARNVVGTDLSDRLFASSNGSVLQGGLGQNELFGGSGADVFVAPTRKIVFSSNGNTNEVFDFVLGSDRIDVSAYGITSFKQLNHILEENLDGDTYFEVSFHSFKSSFTINGVGIEQLRSRDFIFYTGDVTEVIGDSRGDYLFAGSKGSVLKGLAGNDVLVGGDGNDRLDGGKGDDDFYGGRGDDVYVVDSDQDMIVEASGEGVDLVISYSNTGVKLADNVENLIVKGDSENVDGEGNDLANVITGNSGANWLVGNGGNDTLIGGAGRDELDGGAGNDTLNGGSGVDSMMGGAGDDIYIVDEKYDSVNEDWQGGIDLVKASCSYTLGWEVENLTLTGTGNTNGTGNDVSNTIKGNSGNNILRGNGGHDILIGGAGNDMLDGGSFDDGIGIDRMYGGTGNDSYLVGETRDKVIEKEGEGIDSVESWVSYVLPANVENLTLKNAGDADGTGNQLNNVIVGGRLENTLKGMSGDDTLVGGLGGDDLYGGAGKDTFVFTSLKDSTVAASGRDTIFDFSQTQGDRIDISGVDAISATSKNDAFAFIGSKGFSGKAGELRFEKKAAGTYIYGDVDGNGKADFAIELGSAIALLKGDFIL
nr:calcium-binding protein [uncultured Shinella sp.]